MIDIPDRELSVLGRLIVDWSDRQTFPPSQADLARVFKVSKSTISNWLRGEAGMVKPQNLEQIAKVTRIHYDVLLEAVLRDAGYVPGEGGGGSAASTKRHAG